MLVSAVLLIASIVDYAVKAVQHFRDTPEGAAEWADVEARFEAFTGDDVGASEAQGRAQSIRENVSQHRSARADKRPLERISIETMPRE